MMKVLIDIMKKISVLLIIAAVVIQNPFSFFAAESKTVRVAYIDYYNFINKDSEGNMYGYAVDYLDRVAEYTGWRYDYFYMAWPEAIENLAAGRIDFICSATKDEQLSLIHI